ncbi:MAG TPA: hypothetical protein VFJ17_04515 [Mycobacteriales bacterium]|jgi:hypothetical protein|nr:hypothetical protein [Mycobacteriales bacterium]
MTRQRLAVALVPGSLALLVAAACGGGGSSASLRSGGNPVTHQVSDTDSGATVQAHVGDDVVVTLHSTYWQVGDPSGGVLVAVGAPQAEPGGASCSPSVPGSGCGTVRADYRVAQAGTTRIVAGRVSCGEAMRCTGKQGRWSVTVVASR